MIEKLLNLKNTNKILFWVLLPLVAIAFGINLLMKANVLGAKRDLKKTELEVIDLEKEKDAAIKKANELQGEAQTHENNALKHHDAADDARAESEVQEAMKADRDLNWHKK